MKTTKFISPAQVEYDEAIDAAYVKYNKARRSFVEIYEEKIKFANADLNKSIAPAATAYDKERTAAVVKYQKANQSK